MTSNSNQVKKGLPRRLFWATLGEEAGLIINQIDGFEIKHTILLVSSKI